MIGHPHQPQRSSLCSKGGITTAIPIVRREEGRDTLLLIRIEPWKHRCSAPPERGLGHSSRQSRLHHRTASDVEALLLESPRGVLTRARIRSVTGGTNTGRSREARIELTLKRGEVAVFDGALRPAL